MRAYPGDVGQTYAKWGSYSQPKTRKINDHALFRHLFSWRHLLIIIYRLHNPNFLWKIKKKSLLIACRGFKTRTFEISSCNLRNLFVTVVWKQPNDFVYHYYYYYCFCNYQYFVSADGVYITLLSGSCTVGNGAETWNIKFFISRFHMAFRGFGLHELVFLSFSTKMNTLGVRSVAYQLQKVSNFVANHAMKDGVQIALQFPCKKKILW